MQPRRFRPFRFRPAFRRWRRIFWFTVLGVVLLGLSLVVWVSFNLPNMEALDNTEANLSTVVYSRDGEILGNFFSNENRIPVRLNEIPVHLKNALIATEDHRFYTHAGVDLWGQFRALFKIATGSSQGGSTLTMQLARNLYDEQEVGRNRTVLRKLKEMIASVFLERKYTKDEILMHYLNTVPFGGVRYGVQSAARFYFNKDCKDLSLEESATLVGILKGASYYNPYKYPDRVLGRRNLVLDKMVEHGFLSQRQADTTAQKALKVATVQLAEHSQGLAPYFREHLRQWLKKWADENGYNIYTDGLRVFSTIDARLQRHAEAAVARHLKDYQKVFDGHIKGQEPWLRDKNIIFRGMRQSARWAAGIRRGMSEGDILAEFNTPIPMRVFSWAKPEGIDTTLSPRDSVEYYARYLETGAVTIEPNTGHVLAWVGGVNHQFFKYDHVVQGRRQVGSTFKPFVYTAAFDNGYSPCYGVSNMPFTMLTEVGQKWSPKNADAKYTSCISLREALAQSVNVPTARLMKTVGPRVVAEYARKMGITTPLEEVPSLALGTTDLQVMELASAYCTYANKGRWIEPMFITRIEDRNGNVIANFTPNSRQALSEETAYLMVDMLRSVVNAGTAAGLRWSHQLGAQIDICGKTGTTNKHTDGWFVGFTPEYCTAVWVGHSDQAVHFNSLIWGQGAKMAMPIWGYYMKGVYDDKKIAVKPKRFAVPKAELLVQTDCRVYAKQYPQNICGAQKENPYSDDSENPYNPIGGFE